MYHVDKIQLSKKLDSKQERALKPKLHEYFYALVFSKVMP